MANETLAGLLEREHREIDQGMEAFALAPADSDHLAGLLKAIHALRRHIYLEETLLFPELRAAGFIAPVFVMLREHGDMWPILDELEAAAGSAGERDSMLALCARLAGQLEAHNLKEERILYPQANTTVPAGATAELKEFIASGQLPANWRCAQAPAI
jgi:regulator of cell morphogenesis and NO signaling